MALKTDQKEAAQEPAGTQLDIEKTAVDRAVKALRDYQGGKSTVRQVGEALRAVSLPDLTWVSLGTRIPVPQLRALRGG